tara:strand:- start:354 stop:518 length:165 start_codon:yes stop_codon:yes gene_type:complete
MQELIEIVEDLETLEAYEGTPSFHVAMDTILTKWTERKDAAEEEMERQYVMDFK